MNFEQINSFMTSAVCLNFSLAARYHFVSVSTLSRNINALEEELGVRLFERGFHGHGITDAGSAFFDLCINYSKEMNRYLMRWGKGDNEAVRIACSSKEGYAKLINCCARASMEQLSAHIRVSFVDEEDMENAVNSGFTDMLVIDAEQRNKFSNLKYADFFTEKGTEYFFAHLSSRDEELFGKIIGLKKYMK